MRTYSIMIHVCARGARADEAFEWLERMEAVRMEARASVAPIALARALTLALALALTLAALALILTLTRKQAGIAPNAVTLSALINACGRAGRLTGPRGAFRVLADMQRAGLTPNVITYTTLLDACAKACWLGLG